MDTGTAESIRHEHAELYRELSEASRLGGETARAASEVMRFLFPHLLLEDELAIPPLELLPALARGEFDPAMTRILRATDTLKAELPRMLDEHRRIAEGLRWLLQAATKERHPGYAAFAQRLIHHAQMEEEILYPAAILVGEQVRLLAARRRLSEAVA